MTDDDDAGLSRREVLVRGGAAAVVVFGPVSCGGGRQAALPLGQLPDGASSFLSAEELRTLDAAVDRFIPEDTDPGASAAGCADAINALLSAFSVDPPFIFAGAPFSDRGGAPHNDFEDFLALDRYEAFAWRLKIEGSQGLAEREFNGPRKGWQAIYRDGLARLNERAAEAGFASFADMPPESRDPLLRDGSDAPIAELVDVAFLHTLDTMYGAPEYGGNRDLAGWGFTGYDGDVQPRGYTNEQVTEPDNPGLLDMPASDAWPDLLAAFRELIAMSSGEVALGVILNTDSRLSRLRAQIRRWQA